MTCQSSAAALYGFEPHEQSGAHIGDVSEHSTSVTWSDLEMCIGVADGMPDAWEETWHSLELSRRELSNGARYALNGCLHPSLCPCISHVWKNGA